MIHIKADKINNLTDARYFAAKGVQWLCFNFEQGTDGAINPSVAKAIMEWVEGAVIIGRWNFLPLLEMEAWCKLLNIYTIQISNFYNLTDKPAHISIIQYLRCSEWESFDALRAAMRRAAAYAQLFELELDVNWTDAYEMLYELKQEFKIIFKLNLQPIDLELFIKAIQPYGLTLCGGEEERVGVKSFDELEVIFDILDEVA